MAWNRDCKETPKQNFETGQVYLWNLLYIKAHFLMPQSQFHSRLSPLQWR